MESDHLASLTDQTQPTAVIQREKHAIKYELDSMLAKRKEWGDQFWREGKIVQEEKLGGMVQLWGAG